MRQPVTEEAVEYFENTPEITRATPRGRQTNRAPVSEVHEPMRTRSRQRQRVPATQATFIDDNAEVRRPQHRRDRQRVPATSASYAGHDSNIGLQQRAQRQKIVATQPSFINDEQNLNFNNAPTAATFTAENKDVDIIAPVVTPPPAPQIPVTSFTCVDKIKGGFYADVEADCTVFHICSQGRHNK